MSTRLNRWASQLHRARDRRFAAQRTDGDLVTEFARSRDDEAFAELVRRHGPMVLSTCRRIVSPDAHIADDAFQATFMVLAMRAGAVSPPERVGAWLHGVAVNVARKALAWSRKLAQPTPPDLDRYPSNRREPDPDSALVRGAIDEVLAGLPAKYRSPVVLCELEGRSRAEAAETLGVNVGTLSGRLARAKKLLADRLTRRGVTLPAAGLGAALTPGSLAAAVSERLLASTVRSAALLAAGATADEAAPSAVAALARTASPPAFASFEVVAAAAAGVVLLVGAIGLAGLLDARHPDPPRSGPVAAAGGPPARLVPLPVPDWTLAHTAEHRHPVTAVAFGTDFVAAGDAGGGLTLWDARTGAEREAILDGTGRKGKPVDRVQLSPDGAWLYLVTEKSESLHQCSVEKAGRVFPSAGGRGNWVTYGATSDGDYWLERPAGTNQLFLVKNTLAEKRFGGFPDARFAHEEAIDLAAAGPAEAVATVSGGVLRLWSRDLDEPLWEAALGKFEPAALAVGPDVRTVAVAGNGEVRLYAADTGKLAATLRGHAGAVRAVAFSRDGARVVTGGEDRTARVYDAATGRELAVLAGHEGAVTAVAVGPDGDRIATGSDDKTVKVWWVGGADRAGIAVMRLGLRSVSAE